MKFIVILVTYISLLYSHPHTFIEVHPTLSIKNKITEEINFVWKLDEMTSSMLIMEFDENANNILDLEEQPYIYENYFKKLMMYNFYSDITVNKKIEKFPNPTNFKAYIENNKICYSFDIKKNFNINETLIDFGDTDFFIAMILKKEFVTVTGAEAKVSDLDNDFYFGYRLELQ